MGDQKPISKSINRLIYKGFDNEDGNEIAWNLLDVQSLRLCDAECNALLTLLDSYRQINHPNVLQYKHVERLMTQNKLLIITELMTSGSLREYIKRIKTLRPKVIKKWMAKVVEGISYLHSNSIIHGRISGKSIYMNNGGIKIGDLGVWTISTYAFAPTKSLDFEGLLNIDIVKDQP